MLTIGTLQAETEIFLSWFLFHILMLSTYGGFSLVSAEGSAAASSVYGVRGLWALFCLVWLSHASGGGVGFLFGVRVWLGVVLESQGKALKVLSPRTCSQRPADSFEC